MSDNTESENIQSDEVSDNNASEETPSETTEQKQPDESQAGRNSIEVDYEFITNLYNIADVQVPENIEPGSLQSVLEKIKSKINVANSLQKAGSISANPAEMTAESQEADDSSRPKTVLVVDDLGIVTMQLAALFKKLGFEVTTSRELFDAIKKYKTEDFGYAVVDLFIPTEREGFILIDEIKKLSLLCRLDTKIVVMSASNKKEHKDKCKSKGAHIFIEKTSGWQNKIVDYVTGKTSS